MIEAAATPCSVCRLVTLPLTSRTWAETDGTPATTSTMHPPHKCRSMTRAWVGGSCRKGFYSVYPLQNAQASGRGASGQLLRLPYGKALQDRESAGVGAEMVEPVIDVRRVHDREVRRHLRGQRPGSAPQPEGPRG